MDNVKHRLVHRGKLLRQWTVFGLLVLIATAALSEDKELSVDPLTSTEYWQVGGQRIYYVLGTSSLAASAEQTREGAEASLKLSYDFEEPRRSYISAYHIGPAIPGRCEEVSFYLYGDGSNRPLALSIEDARGRWFEKKVGAIDWEGWKQATAAIGSGEGWRALLRRGEESLPILHPINLRQIAVYRAKDAPLTGAIFLHDLRARCDVVPADFVDARLDIGREANLFYLGETPTVTLELTSHAEQPVAGKLTVAVSDFFGKTTDIDLGPVELPSGGATQKRLECPTDRLGTYTAAVKLQSGERERVWFAQFVVSAPAPERAADPNALFGCMFNVQQFPRDQWDTVLRLNRDAGIRWSRIGFGWNEINPAPGVWAWDAEKRVQGPVGKAISLDRQTLCLPHAPVLDCPEAVTIAFWARCNGSNDDWQSPLQKWGPSNRRNYGVYFGKSNGQFCFSASYENFPDAKHVDRNSGFSAWDDQWHHYAAAYSSVEKKVALYVDGETKLAEALDGGRLRTNTDDLVIGRGFSGALDEMTLYRRALQPEEVASLAQKKSPPAEGLVAWWSFEEDGAVVADRSPNHQDARQDEPSSVKMARLALEHGIKTLGLLGFPPRWASTAPEDAVRFRAYKPKLDAWAEYVENVTRHYKDVVQHWEIWNEPNITTFWMPEPDPKEYMDVLTTGYEAAKRGNPNCTVIMPGLAGPGQNQYGMGFLDELFKLGAANYCDAIAIHPYRQTTPEESGLVGDLKHIADMAEAHGARRKIWFTENCWTTQLPSASSEHRETLMLPRCYVLALGTGLMEHLIWFRFHDPGVDRFYLEHNCGLCYNDLTPKPVYMAHRTVAMLLDGSTPDGAWDVGPDAKAQCFRTKTERIAAVWAPERTAPVSLFVGAPSVRMVDIMGNETRSETPDGVLLLDASEAIVFLRGLGDKAEGRGTVLCGSAPPFVRGEKAKLTIQIRNPFPKAERADLLLSAATPCPLVISAPRAAIDVPGNSEKTAEFEALVPEAALPGEYMLSASLDFAGRHFEKEIAVCVRSAPPNAGPVGCWKLDEGQGNAINDASGCGNHGTVENPRWVEGKRGTALEFDGAHIAVIPDSPSLNLRDEVTLAFWLKVVDKTGTWQSPVTKYFQGDVCRNYGIYLTPDDLMPRFSASFEKASFRHTDRGPNVSLTLGEWHHIAATYSMFDKRMRFYVDGKLEMDQPLVEGAMRPTTDPLRLGTGTRGVIDEALIYPRALSPEEAAELAQ